LEIYRSVGLESAIREAAPQSLKDMRIVRVETLVGKELGTSLENTSDYTMAASPISGSIIPQDILEPLLYKPALKLGANLRFSTGCVSFEQDTDGVSAVICDLASGQTLNIRAHYLVAADGNRSPIGKKLGIRWQGPGTLAHQMNMLFRADLRAPLRGRRLLAVMIASVQGMFAGNHDGGFLSVPYDPEQAFLNYIERLNPARASQATVEKIAYEIPIFGYIYHSAVVLSEDNALYEDPQYPSGRPGTRAPHVPLERADKPLSSHDLFGRNFVLLTGSEGLPWCEASSAVAQRLDITLDVYRMGADVADADERFYSTYGISPAGVTLVRPGGFIAWRAHANHQQPAQELERVLIQVLCR
jgi:hypothetical protein